MVLGRDFKRAESAESAGMQDYPMHSAVSCDTPSQDYATTHIHDTPSDINANRPPRPSADASTGADVSSHTYPLAGWLL